MLFFLKYFAISNITIPERAKGSMNSQSFIPKGVTLRITERGVYKIARCANRKRKNAKVKNLFEKTPILSKGFLDLQEKMKNISNKTSEVKTIVLTFSTG